MCTSTSFPSVVSSQQQEKRRVEFEQKITGLRDKDGDDPVPCMRKLSFSDSSNKEQTNASPALNQPFIDFRDLFNRLPQQCFRPFPFFVCPIVLLHCRDPLSASLAAYGLFFDSVLSQLTKHKGQCLPSATTRKRRDGTYKPHMQGVGGANAYLHGAGQPYQRKETLVSNIAEPPQQREHAIPVAKEKQVQHKISPQNKVLSQRLRMRRTAQASRGTTSLTRNRPPPHLLSGHRHHHPPGQVSRGPCSLRHVPRFANSATLGIDPTGFRVLYTTGAERIRMKAGGGWGEGSVLMRPSCSGSSTTDTVSLKRYSHFKY